MNIRRTRQRHSSPPPARTQCRRPSHPSEADLHSPMDCNTDNATPLQPFLLWAQSLGVQLHSIHPASIPRRGTGIRATHPIEATPPRAVRRLSSIPPPIRLSLPPSTPIHALLAADLALNAPPPWTAILPDPSGMPLLWPRELQSLLPRSSRALLHAQTTLFSTHWAAVAPAFPGMRLREFRSAWLAVNSRSFLDGSDDASAYPWGDRLALVAVADLFNHGGTHRDENGCRVLYGEDGGYSVCAERAYDVGDELLISYGDHDHDALLVEYGFVPDGDEVGTQWHDEIAGALTRDSLSGFLATVRARIEMIAGLAVGLDSQRALLTTRWSRIAAAASQALDCMP